MENLFLEKELPVEDLRKIGLYDDGGLLLSSDNLRALLAGRRTEMIGLNNLQADGFVIKNIDAKLSLEKAQDGSVSLKVHPIHKTPQEHPLLNDYEAAVLRSGHIDSIRKVYGSPDSKNAKSYVIEYDADTKEFIQYEPDQVQAPDQVNNETLTKKQKEDFRNGDLVTLSDGTRFQHRASTSKGILSDRTALILSVLFDGGISYLILTGIRNLLDGNPQKNAYNQGYAEALKQAEQHQQEQKPDQIIQQEQSEERLDRGKFRSR